MTQLCEPVDADFANAVARRIQGSAVTWLASSGRGLPGSSARGCEQGHAVRGWALDAAGWARRWRASESLMGVGRWDAASLAAFRLAKVFSQQSGCGGGPEERRQRSVEARWVLTEGSDAQGTCSAFANTSAGAVHSKRLAPIEK